MDLSTLGVDILFVVGIIAAVKFATLYFDPNGKLARWYPLAPIVFSAPLSVLRWWSQGWPTIVFNAVIYGALAAWVYKTGKTTILDQ